VSINQLNPYPLGAHVEGQGIRFSFISGEKDCGIILFEGKNGNMTEKIPFLPEERIGNIYCKFVQDLKADAISYLFYEGDRSVPDPCGRAFIKDIDYGICRSESEFRAYIPDHDYDWGTDTSPGIPYENSILYNLHVRGFTKHASSDVKNRGTFRGMTEKIPYLKALGITAIELQPAYEFMEVPSREEQDRMVLSPYYNAEAAKQMTDDGHVLNEEVKINYWGYKKGYYYAPKGNYAAGNNPSEELKETIRTFHKHDMEVIMQFYFPAQMPVSEIPDILRFWKLEYHIDGFHLLGENIPARLVAQEALLADSKLLFHDIYADTAADSALPSHNLAIYRDDYRNVMRRFLKGDEGTLNNALHFLRNNPADMGYINYFTCYNGFTLMDMVSYERKHNEANGEDNCDGTDLNYSWNCGAEGVSRKKKVLQLRNKQMKNALSLLYLSQSVPLIFMGDEFGNSQKGNNNPYCQDNEITWLNWKNLDKNRDIYDFTSMLISLRRRYPILHAGREMRLMDYLSCGYPDLSYHGEESWRTSIDYYKRHIGLLYCGRYAAKEKDENIPDDFIYIAINMHWEPHEYAVPKLPKGLTWELNFSTDEDVEISDSGTCWQLPARSIAVFTSKGHRYKAPKGMRSQKNTGNPKSMNSSQSTGGSQSKSSQKNAGIPKCCEIKETDRKVESV